VSRLNRDYQGRAGRTVHESTDRRARPASAVP